MAVEDDFRQLEKSWDLWMIAGAMVVSFLGTFTATQLMIQARTSTQFSHVLTWTLTVSLVFGFCSSWSLHFVGMLSCKLDIPIALDVGLTLFTGSLAVGFTFISLGKDVLRSSYGRPSRQEAVRSANDEVQDEVSDAVPLLGHEPSSPPRLSRDQNSRVSHPRTIPQKIAAAGRPCSDQNFASHASAVSLDSADNYEHTNGASIPGQYGSGMEEEPGSFSPPQWSFGTAKVDDLMSMATQGTGPRKGAFMATFDGLVAGFCLESVLMGLLWSLSLTCMHYGGLLAMRIPEGYMTLSPVPVVISAFISWIVCIAGYIYMTNVEPFFSQQILFSAVAAAGIAAMHFTGLHAATFYSRLPPAHVETWPATLPIAVCSIAFLTCMLANGLLAHSAIVSRNKLAEIVWTRRKLWRTMAEKELAEASAATRSTFIASASHEIRTPLHHLQGYTDLLARADLKDEDRQLLNAIQSATRTLSLITNNVLDWSKLESNMDTVSRPTPLDLRAVFESIVHILPWAEEDVNVEFMVVIDPKVPKILLLDETYIHRIFMNLLSNALKFTKTGYVLLRMEYDGSSLITRVEDTGIGIPKAFLPRLFEPFSQAQTSGSQRGTGLGLSITKQLLQKMDGTVTVESHYTEGHTPESTTGTVFTVTIPVPLASLDHIFTEASTTTGTIAVFPRSHTNRREGHIVAWEYLGFNVVETKHFSELENLIDATYIWADAEYLQQDPDALEALLHQKERIVLVPYSQQEILPRLPGVMSASHFVLLPKPLIWHTFQTRIALASLTPSEDLRISRETSTLCMTDTSEVATALDSAVQNEVSILLVEDNPINQKLATKMLTSLGYLVMVAADGNEAISLLLQHDISIDMVLMDQSMPNKDGVTATREIRQLEAQGQLLRKHVIIAVTAVVDSESRASFNSAGADEFLSKPLSMGRLEQTLATFLRVE